MKPYHPANLKHQPYGHGRVVLLAWIAKALGVQFHIHGLPFGGKAKGAAWEEEKCMAHNQATAHWGFRKAFFADGACDRLER